MTYAGNLESLADLRRDPRHVFVRGDIANAELVEHLCEQHAVDAIVNLAAESHVDRSILGPGIFVETNVTGTQILLEAARRSGVRRFVQVSTDEVYGSLGADGCCWPSSARGRARSTTSARTTSGRTCPSSASCWRSCGNPST